MQRLAILIILLSVALPFLWSLDANLLLLIYDTYVAVGIAHHHHHHHHHDNGLRQRRRVFPPGSTPTLEGKTIWITGSSSGIGAELAIQLASAGVGHLILSGRREDKLESVADSCREASSEWRTTMMIPSTTTTADDDTTNSQGTTRVSIVPFDMSAGSDILDKSVSTALHLAGPSGIDILVLNAGQYQCSPALDTNLDAALPALMNVNFASPARLSQKVMRMDRWKERGHGHIVTVTSLMGRGASPLNALYSASKHALRGYFAALAAEERSWLRVDLVLPGATDTGLWSGSYDAAKASSSAGASSEERGAIASGNDEGGGQRDDSGKLLHADDRSKMAVGRCAQLIVSSMIGPHFLFFETWITRNPGLLWVYLASCCPMTFQLLTNVVGPLRTAMWRKNGEDALYVPTLLRQLWGCVVDYASGRSDHLLP